MGYLRGHLAVRSARRSNRHRTPCHPSRRFSSLTARGVRVRPSHHGLDQVSASIAAVNHGDRPKHGSWLSARRVTARSLRSPFFSARRVLMSAYNRTVDQTQAVRRSACQRFENATPNTGLGPPIEPVIDRGVGAIALRQISPGRPCPQNIENPVQHPPILTRRTATPRCPVTTG